MTQIQTPTLGQETPPFEILVERPPAGLVRRFFQIHKHLVALGFGWLYHLRETEKATGRKRNILGRWFLGFGSLVSKIFLDKKLLGRPFPVQFRLRLERLGPTYIKLGQILSLRKDLLPNAITSELQNLLDHLPVVTYKRYLELVEEHLNRPIEECFAWVDDSPLGSASLAQIHRARLLSGEEVVLKVLKPGIRETVLRDIRLLRFLGRLLEGFIPRFQPRRLIEEFCKYTVREIDMRLEANNAETFAANFAGESDIVFPTIYRQFSSESILCMTYLAGQKPSRECAAQLSAEQRKKVVNLGAKAIIKMIYQDGFFHADLHPGNLVILPDAKVGFIDLGMVGRYDDETRKNLLYYFYALVMGDPENAAHYLLAITHYDSRSDPKGFRQAVEDMSRRWLLHPTFEVYSLAQLILESLMVCGQYRIYYPGEMVLMVKALITYEGVGYVMDPELDIAVLSRKYVRKVFLQQFNLLELAQEGLKSAPELIDALVKSPMLLSEGLRFLEQKIRKPGRSDVPGLKSALLGGFALLSAVILLGMGGPWPIWTTLFLLASGFAVHAFQNSR